MIKPFRGKLLWLSCFTSHECFTIEIFPAYKIIFINTVRLKCFKIDKSHSGLPLPNPCGPLNLQLSSIVIVEVHKEVTEAL